MTEEAKQKIQRIADFYGYDAQSRQCIEEMAELTQAINKFWRKELKCGKNPITNVPFRSPNERNIEEEITDVLICIEQLKYLLAIGDSWIEEIIEQKLDRQIGRIEGNE